MEKLSGKGKKSSTHKYDIKISSHEKRRVQTQDIGNAFEIKRSATKNNLVQLKTAISKPDGNHKPKIYNRYTYKKEKAIQTHH